MVAFECNICGAYSQVEVFETEPASCRGGSNVRLRALVHLLSMELFGYSLVLKDFPRLKSIRGLGIADSLCYANILADKFDYTNTYYDREPRFDLTESHPQSAGMYDFILAADVLEHIEPPVERALEEVHRLLKPHGFFGITIFCNPDDRMREHFPDLYDFRLVRLGDSTVLVNRRREGSIEVRDEIVFHGGTGATLEMREFGATELRSKLLAVGFQGFSYPIDDMPDSGILFAHDVSQPLIARKQPFVLNQGAVTELVQQWRSAEDQARNAFTLAQQLRLASQSKWVRLGVWLGLSPGSRSRE